jgi:hypothetical protein
LPTAGACRSSFSKYQGSGHFIDRTAGQRDDVKREALERAGVRYVEIPDGTTPDEMQRIIRHRLTVVAPDDATA